MKCDKSYKAPQALVKETRVNERKQSVSCRIKFCLFSNNHGIVYNCCACHAPRERACSRSTVSLLIYKVSPSAYALTYKKSETAHIEHCGKVYLMDNAGNRRRNRRRNNTAVYRKPSVTQIEEIYIGINENTVVGSCTDKAENYGYKGYVENVVGDKPELLALVHSVNKRKNHAYRNNNSVPVDVNAEQIECYPVYDNRLIEQVRKFNSRHFVHRFGQNV